MVMRILDVVDMQFDFMKARGRLYVNGAEALIPKANQFFMDIPHGAFDLALIKLDTHFEDEYERSPEKRIDNFPIHCEYGTEGWNLVVDAKLLDGKMPVRYLTKNTFDMWGKNPLAQRDSGPKIVFRNDDEKKAYANLRRITPDNMGLGAGIRLDKFMDGQKSGLEVTMIGVASDFCVDDAIRGYLKRGATVTVVEDLVTGIGTPAEDRAPSGKIEDVVQLPRYQPYVQSGHLKLAKARDVLAHLRNG